MICDFVIASFCVKKFPYEFSAFFQKFSEFFVESDIFGLLRAGWGGVRWGGEAECGQLRRLAPHATAVSAKATSGATQAQGDN